MMKLFNSNAAHLSTTTARAICAARKSRRRRPARLLPDVCPGDEQTQADNYEADHYFGPAFFVTDSGRHGADEPSQVGISFRELLLEMGKERCRFRPSLF